MFRELEEFLIKQCGTTEQFLDVLVDDSSKHSIRSIFFKPYPTKFNFFKSLASIITAPIIFTFLSVEVTLCCFIYAGAALFDLIKLNTEDAQKNFKKAVKGLSGIFIMIIAAVISPIINLVDFLGSVVTTLIELNKESTPEGWVSPSV